MSQSFYAACSLLLFVFGAALADTENSSQSHTLSSGFTQLSPGSAQVTGADPYLVLPLRSSLAINETSGGRTASLPLQIMRKQLGPSQGVVSGELFYKRTGDTHNFDPNYKIRFRFPNDVFTKITLELGDALDLDVDSLRLDFDDCDSCIVNYGTHFQLDELPQGTLGDAATAITPYRTYNGVNDLGNATQTIEPSQWRLNDFMSDDETLSVTGGDPYLVSPTLDTSTENLAGIAFNFRRINQASSGTTKGFQDFQLFYSSNRAPFLERESLIFRVSKNPLGDDTSQFQFFIPLSFLGNENHAVLEQLRLDFASHGVTSNNHLLSTHWNFVGANLVPKRDAEEYSKIHPIRLARHSLRDLSKRRVAANIFTRFSNDWGFIVLYIAGLLLFCLYGAQRFVKTNAN